MSRTQTIAFVPRNRLASVLTAPNRIDFAEHVTRAEKRVEEIRPALALALDDRIEALTRLCHQDEIVAFETCHEIGRAALAVMEGARLAGRDDLAEAAEGIWDMVLALSGQGVWHTDALRLHGAALITLSKCDRPEGGDAIVQELRRLRIVIGVRAEP